MEQEETTDARTIDADAILLPKTHVIRSKLLQLPVRVSNPVLRIHLCSDGLYNRFRCQACPAPHVLGYVLHLFSIAFVWLQC